MNPIEDFEGTLSEVENQEDGRKGRGDGREGYRPMNDNNGRTNRGEQRQRTRFTRVQRNYGEEGNNDRGFRPVTFGPGSNNNNNGYRPAYNNRNNYQRNNYDNRQGYNRGGYQERGGYNNQYQNGGYGQEQQDGFRPGGFQQQQGYRPRQGGYNQRQGGYNQRQGGYNQRQQGGYNPRQQGGGYGYNQQGYGPRQGGYNQRQQGGYGRGPQNMRGNHQKPGKYNQSPRPNLKKRIDYKEYIEDPNAPIRLNRFLANAGVCSRREADQFIQAGVVKVNGEIVTELGTKVKRTDTIHFHDQLVSLEKKVYVLLNKPKDYVTTSDDPQARKTVMDLVKNCCKERIYPVGRLDRNTTGVLLFTNDGDLASKLTHPKFLKKKVYHVKLDKNISADDIKQIAEGITLDDGDINADAIDYASDTDKSQVGIEIHSGKNRIVRRIFESLGYRVLRLDRVMFAGLTKKGLKRGDWRFLTEQEVAMLHMGGYE